MLQLISFWDIPPIQDAIARHLTPFECWNCIRVSRRMHQVFIPFLWRNIACNYHPRSSNPKLSFRSYFALPTQPHHRDLVQTLHVVGHWFRTFERNFKAHGPFPNLKSFTYSYGYERGNREDMKYLRIAQAHSRTLESLHCQWQEFSREFRVRLGKMLYQSRNIRRLQMESIPGYSCEDLDYIFTKSRHLEYMDMSSRRKARPSSWQYDNTKSKFEETRIRTLKVSLYEHGLSITDLVLRFLRFCPYLKCLELKMEFLKDPEGWAVLGRLVEAQCPRLEELHLWAGVDSSMAFVKFLEVAPRFECKNTFRPGFYFHLTAKTQSLKVVSGWSSGSGWDDECHNQ